MSSDHHSFAGNLIRSLLKGAFLGFLVGSSFVSIGRQSPMYWKKIRMFAGSSRLNEAKMIWAVNRNFILLGAGVSASQFMLWNSLSTVAF